jgi:hypothetical protein
VSLWAGRGVWSRVSDEAEKRRTETDGPALPLDVQTVLAVQRAAGNRALVDALSGGQGEMLLRARGTRGRRPSPDKPYRKAKASSPYAHIPKSPRLAGAAARGINAPASGPGGYHFWRGGRPGWSPSIDEKLNNVTNLSTAA